MPEITQRAPIDLGAPDHCLTSVEVAAASVTRGQWVHCYLGAANALESEIILDLLQKKGVPVTFSAGSGARLDEEQAFHLANFLDGVRSAYDTDFSRRRAYRIWRDKLINAGENAAPREDVVTQKYRRPLPSVRAAVRRWFEPTPVQKETKHIEDLYREARAATASGEGLPDRCLICGWYGTETLGDKAIIGGVVESFRAQYPGLVVDVASIEPYVTKMTAAQMPDLGFEKVLSMTEARWAISEGRYSCVVIGGGPLMSPVPWCTALLEFFAAAKKVGARCVVAGCGVGPLSVTHRNAAIKYSLELADEVVVRDEGSAHAARRDLGVERECKVGLDPAFVWIRNHLEDVPRDENQILLALRDWPYEEFASHLGRPAALEKKERLEAEMVRCVEELKRLRPQARIVPFCMHKYAVGGDDRLFYRRIFADLPEVLAELDNRHRRPVDDLRTIAGSRAILAMRFHSVVFSLATNTPFLALDYTLGGKISHVLKDTGMAGQLIALDGFDGAQTARRLLEVQPMASGTLDAKVQRTAELLGGAFAGQEFSRS